MINRTVNILPAQKYKRHTYMHTHAFTHTRVVLGIALESLLGDNVAVALFH